jgi:hypothetical protein
MPGHDPGIHALFFPPQDVDGRVKPGHDDKCDGLPIHLVKTRFALLPGSDGSGYTSPPPLVTRRRW